MQFTVIREIDKLGRILLPVDMRKFYDFAPSSLVSVRIEGEYILITKAEKEAQDTKRVDKIGRIVIPKSVRNVLKSEKAFVNVMPCEQGVRLCVACD